MQMYRKTRKKRQKKKAIGGQSYQYLLKIEKVPYDRNSTGKSGRFLKNAE